MEICDQECVSRSELSVQKEATGTFFFYSELCFVNKTEWHKIRGAQMLVAMKVISIAFDADFGALQCLPSPAEFTGYVLCVGTCVFGPWVPYRDYISIFNKPVWVSISPTICGALNLIVL